MTWGEGRKFSVKLFIYYNIVNEEQKQRAVQQVVGWFPDTLTVPHKTNEQADTFLFLQHQREWTSKLASARARQTALGIDGFTCVLRSRLHAAARAHTQHNGSYLNEASADTCTIITPQ